MVELIFLAIGTGFLLSFGFGSVFFALIQSSIDYGFKAGRNLAFGVALSDVVLIFLAVFGTTILPSIPNFEFYAKIVGSMLLIGLGIVQFRKFTKSTSFINSGVGNKIYFISKGILLNVINPVNFFSWVVVSTTLKSYHYRIREELLFFIICVFVVFLTETLIAYYADKISHRFSDKTITYIKFGTGLLFIGIGLKILFSAF